MAQANPKVLWKEGLFLLPHHFQQWERYHENLLNFRVRQLLPFGWGVIEEVKINRDGLMTGHFSLESFRGILPNGTVIDIPDVDDPPARQIPGALSSQFSAYLAIPLERASAANCRLVEGNEGANERRYLEDSVQVVDANTGENRQGIATAKKNLKILFEGESSDHDERIKIAELVRTGAESFKLNDDYIPPPLVVSASARLMNILEGLIHALTAKSNALLGQCQQRSLELYEFSGTEPTTLWLLHTLNSFIPVLNHFHRVQRVPPEEVFCSLSQLAGELSMFAVKFRLENLPSYHHEDVLSSFTALDQTIRELLELITPSLRYTSLRVQKTESPEGNPIFVAEVEERLLSPAYRFYIAIEEQDYSDQIPNMVQIAARTEIDLLIRRALPGIKLTAIPAGLLPTTVPKKSGYAYFYLEKSRKEDLTSVRLWENVRISRQLAIYTSAEFRELELKELIAAEE